jgi:mono/diheme cytochrome c family protein
MIVVATWIVTAAVLASCGRGASESGSSTAAAPASSGPAATSQYDAGPRAADTPIDESKVATGQQLFQTKGCTACHAFGKRLTCPDLAGVTHRRTIAWMENQILHPDVMTKQDPISHQLFAQFALQMPNQGLTPEEAAAVVEFFKHTDHEAAESASKGE